MHKTVDVGDDILDILDGKATEMGMSVAAVLRYAIRRFALLGFPIEDEFFICPECKTGGKHCEGRNILIGADLANSRRGAGKERRIRYICICKHCREKLGIPLPGPVVTDQYGKVLSTGEELCVRPPEVFGVIDANAAAG